jgi:hypothetical protein
MCGNTAQNVQQWLKMTTPNALVQTWHLFLRAGLQHLREPRVIPSAHVSACARIHRDWAGYRHGGCAAHHLRHRCWYGLHHGQLGASAAASACSHFALMHTVVHAQTLPGLPPQYAPFCVDMTGSRWCTDAPEHTTIGARALPLRGAHSRLRARCIGLSPIYIVMALGLTSASLSAAVPSESD